MKFGIFYEHQIGRPWDDGTEHQLIQDALDQVEFADSLGIQYVWEVEHHFLEEYSHSSAPEVFLAACSQRTKNMRLGHGIILTAPKFNHPARTAERVSMLDLVSGGRVEFGSGESSSEAELAGFGVNPLEKREQWLEGLEVAVRCMAETPFTGVDGKYVQMPPRNVIPKPVQKPHPPLWVACSRRETILLAAEKGMGALTFAFIDPEEAVNWVTEYERTFTEKCVPVGFSVNPQVACVSPMMMHHDEDEAIRRGTEGANFFGYSLGHFYVFGEHQPGKTDVWAQYVERRAAQGYDPDAIAAAVRDRQRVERARRQAGCGRLDRLARQRRHAGASARVPPPIRRSRCRPGDLRAAGRPQPARAHHGVDRDLRSRGAAGVPRPRRGTGQGQAATIGARDRGSHAAARRGLPPRRRRRLLVPGAAGAVGKGHRLTRARSDTADSGPTIVPPANVISAPASPADSAEQISRYGLRNFWVGSHSLTSCSKASIRGTRAPMTSPLKVDSLPQCGRGANGSSAASTVASTGSTSGHDGIHVKWKAMQSRSIARAEPQRVGCDCADLGDLQAPAPAHRAVRRVFASLPERRQLSTNSSDCNSSPLLGVKPMRK